ncbi:MAG: DUF1353 domain-containing protein [Methylobacter sp.]
MPYVYADETERLCRLREAAREWHWMHPKVSRFLSELVIKECKLKPGEYKLADDLVFCDEKAGDIVVPRGFCTDFATVPGIFKWLIDNDEYGIRAPAVVHDYMYSSDAMDDLTREEMDDIFYRAMLARAMATWKAKMVYLAVRVMGGLYYGRRK